MESLHEYWRKQGYVPAEEEEPIERGEYEVLRRQGKYHMYYDTYTWNGNYWVTKGHNPAKGIIAWKKKGA